VLGRTLVAAAVIWVAAIVVSPLAIDAHQPAASLAAAGVYAAGSRICHQRPDRCFRLHGRPMPVCARCTGLYASAAVAAPLALLFAAGVSTRRARLTALAAALPTVLSWTLEMAGLVQPSNLARAIAALPLGFVAAWLVIAVSRRP
jgi:uncharacterized membrane protein